MPRPPVRVLGVDTSLRCSGIGVIEGTGPQLRALVCGVIKNPAALSHTACLNRIFEETGRLIEKYQPNAAAIEGIFFCKNPRTALILGQARGAVLTACARHDLPVYEYAPRLVKQSVSGSGRASKEQVAAMITRMLGLKETPSPDAADALAIAVTHLHQTHLPETLRIAPI